MIVIYRFKCCKTNSVIETRAVEAPKVEEPVQDAVTETGSEEKPEDKEEQETAPVVEESQPEEPVEEKEEEAAPEEEATVEDRSMPVQIEDDTKAENDAVDKSYKCCGVY